MLLLHGEMLPAAIVDIEVSSFAEESYKSLAARCF